MANFAQIRADNSNIRASNLILQDAIGSLSAQVPSSAELNSKQAYMLGPYS